MDPIVVVGLSFQFPEECVSSDQFWKLLIERRSTTRDVPRERFNVDSFYHPDPERFDAIHGRGGNFLRQDLAAFDAPFFSMTSSEASGLDPQQRLLLEATYRALENAGIPLSEIMGTETAVYCASMCREYDALTQRDTERLGQYSATGTSLAMLANRISWFFNLQGPSLTLDTACSSSLYAFNLACQHLQNSSTPMALVGASNIILNPDTIFMPLSNLHFLSPDSHCHSFDVKANGYARGEGVGVLILKKLSRALRDRDIIRAFVKSTLVNQDGRTPGITQPSLDSQKRLIRNCYQRAELDMGLTRFFEAHGTGTKLGDSIEAQAIHETFCQYRSHLDPIIVGAVKSNIGHLEGASGFAGLVKSIIVLENGLIPPNYGWEAPGPGINYEQWCLKFPTTLTSWPSNGLRRVSINSFGFGGANAHAVLDDAFHTLEKLSLDPLGKVCLTAQHPKGRTTKSGFLTETNATVSDRSRVLIPISSNDRDGIFRQKQALQSFVRQEMPDYEGVYGLQDIAYTLSRRRTHLSWRTFVIPTDVSNLSDCLTKDSGIIARSTENTDVAFVFSGQGSLWYGVGKELLNESAFRQTIQKLDQLMRSMGSSWSLIDLMNSESTFIDIHEPEFAQPLCTAIQIGLVEMLRFWGIVPYSVVGHSSGEIAAAYCTGVLSMEQALAIAYFRGKYTSPSYTSLTEGAMLSIGLSEIDLFNSHNFESDGNDMEIACDNSPNSVTASGGRLSIKQLQENLDRQSVFNKLLPISVAYHSKRMKPIIDVYRSAMANYFSTHTKEPDPEASHFFSSVLATQLSPDEYRNSDYWISNLISKVRFRESVGTLCQAWKEQCSQRQGSGDVGNLVIIEIGPHASLRRIVSDNIRENRLQERISYDSVLRINEDASLTALELAGRLHCVGVPVNFESVNQVHNTQRQPLLLPNIPEYQFNHQLKFWSESRLSRNRRFRKHRRHDFLGTRSDDWNPHEARWRNIIKYKEMPWILDHRLNEVSDGSADSSKEIENDSQLYPFGGMLVMALEAVREILASLDTVTGFRFQDVRIHQALYVSTRSEGTEVQLILRSRLPFNNSNEESYEFRLYHLPNGSDDDWLPIVMGNIRVERHSNTVLPDIFESTRNYRDAASYQASLAQVKESAQVPTKKELYYQRLASSGFVFGPTFQTLDHIRSGGDNILTAEVILDAKLARSTSRTLSKYMIHPTALDAVFQLALAAISQGGAQPIPFMLPTQLKDMWISNQDNVFNQGLVFESFVAFRTSGLRETESEFFVLDPRTRMPVIIGTQYKATSLANIYDAFEQPKERNKIYLMQTKPAIETMNTSEIYEHMRGAECQKSEIPTIGPLLELFSVRAMKRVTESLPEHISYGSETHLMHYREWMSTVLKSDIQYRLEEAFGKSCLDLNDLTWTSKLEMLFTGRPYLRLFPRIEANLQKIFEQRVDVLDLFFSDGAAGDFYCSPELTLLYDSLARYIGLLSHRSPGLKVLEIGAGTGATTARLLLREDDSHVESQQLSFSKYVYTDISASFFEPARQRFGDFDGRLQFKVLDISQDPNTQGFEEHSFDLIIAANVLHATSDIQNTLRNTKKLLKDSGKLAIIEPTSTHFVPVTFCFGLTAGWWLSKDADRAHGPLLSVQSWTSNLHRAGFGRLEADFKHPQSPESPYSIMVSSPLCEERPTDLMKVAIVVDLDEEIQIKFAQILSQELLQLRFIETSIVGSTQLDVDFAAETVVSLIDYTASKDFEISQRRWNILKILAHPSRTTLWAARARVGTDNGPFTNTITGLGRCVRSETKCTSFKTVVFSETSPLQSQVTQLLKLTQMVVLSTTPGVDSEYYEIDGLLSTDRIVHAVELEKETRDNEVHLQSQKITLHEVLDRTLTLKIRSPGLLDTLYFVEESRRQIPLEPSEIYIDVKAFGLNFKDILIALGQVPGTSLGLECSGVVTDVGDDVTEYKVGDHICCFSASAFKTKLRVKACMAMKLPKDMTFNEGATVPTVFCTAWHSLMGIARLSKGESVLIHYGAGGVGQAAIQIARSAGAEIFITVGNEAKRRLCMDLYGIPEDHIFYSRDTSFATYIRRMKPEGLDVILNSTTGEVMEATWNCIAPFGRFIEIGKKDILANGKLSMAPFAQNVLFASVDLSLIAVKSVTVLRRIIQSVESLLLTSKKTRPPSPIHVFPANKVEEAFRFLQSGRNTGKCVISLEIQAELSILGYPQPQWMFPPHASYVIAGGLGGIGRSIAKWMATRGAKHIILLSRQGEMNAHAQSLTTEVSVFGATIYTPSCDITDSQALQRVLESIAKQVPPIKGCIQAAMVLKDGIFENMSLDSYHAAVRPKVDGSWNLHSLLPRDLDFFVLLSSTSGLVGNPGQANYAAGNTYQDALARYRISQGQKATAINLGIVLSAGYAADHAEVTANLKSRGYMGIELSEIHALLDFWCNPSRELATHQTCQVVTDIISPASLRSRGLQELMWHSYPMFQCLHIETESDSSQTEASNLKTDVVDTLSTQLKSANSVGEVAETILEHLKEKLSRSLAVPTIEIDAARPIFSYGVDSLVAVELRYWLLNQTGAEIRVMEIMSNQSLRKLCDRIADRVVSNRPT